MIDEFELIWWWVFQLVGIEYRFVDGRGKGWRAGWHRSGLKRHRDSHFTADCSLLNWPRRDLCLFDSMASRLRLMHVLWSGPLSVRRRFHPFPSPHTHIPHLEPGTPLSHLGSTHSHSAFDPAHTCIIESIQINNKKLSETCLCFFVFVDISTYLLHHIYTLFSHWFRQLTFTTQYYIKH